jgi:uncharacterized protein (DUF433 family)
MFEMIASRYEMIAGGPVVVDLRSASKCGVVPTPFFEYPRAMNPPVISRRPDVMGGTPVFSGTRVPVQTLLEYLEAGESIDDFLKGFPTVSREQVVAFLEEATDRLVAATAT